MGKHRDGTADWENLKLEYPPDIRVGTSPEFDDRESFYDYIDFVAMAPFGCTNPRPRRPSQGIQESWSLFYEMDPIV